MSVRPEETTAATEADPREGDVVYPQIGPLLDALDDLTATEEPS